MDNPLTLWRRIERGVSDKGWISLVVEDTDSLDIASRLKVAEDDEDVKDNWDDESEDEEEKAKVAESAPSATTTQPKRKAL